MESVRGYVFLILTLCVACGSTSTNVVGDPGTGGQGGAGALGGQSGAGGTPSGGQSGTGGTSAGGQSGFGGQAGSVATGGTGGADAGGAAGQDAGGTGSAPDAGQDSGTGSTGGSGGADACVPQPCANDNVTCGDVPDGCGGTSKCIHTCAAPETCGAKIPNKCGCTEYTQAEIAALCAGKCAITMKCTPTSVIDCTSYAGSCSVSGPYDLCSDPSSSSGGKCLTCSRPSAADECTYNSGKPFKYSCTAGIACTKGSDCKSGTCGPDGMCTCLLNSDCLTTCDQNTNRCLGYNVDNLQDNGETDVDCGGQSPIKCAPGKKCLKDSDCEGYITGSCQGASPPSTYGTCQNSGGPKVGCSKLDGNFLCCYDSIGGWHPYADATAVAWCAGKGLPFVFIKGSGPSSTPPETGCVAGAGWWCCPNDQFL